MESTEDMFSCPICLENISQRKPRALSCLHSFCTECLKKLPIKKKTLECPICKKKTVLEKADVNCLPENFYLKSPNTVVSNWCESCSISKKKQVKAEVRCIECNILLCKDCEGNHLARSTFRNHRTDKIGSQCMEHKKTLSLYCKTCNKLLCVFCVETHGDHEEAICDVETGYKQLCDDISRDIQIKITKNRTKLTEADKTKSNITKARKELEISYEEAKAKLEKEYEKVMEELDDKSETNDNAVRNLKEAGNSLKSLKQKADKLLDTVDVDDMLKIQRFLRDIKDDIEIPDAKFSIDSNCKDFNIGTLTRVTKEENKNTQIFVKVQDTNKTMTLMVDLSDTVEEMKKDVESRINLPLIKQDLYYGGKKLANSMSLQECGIHKESTIFL